MNSLNKRKHIGGMILLLIFIAYFYSFSPIVFHYVNESSPLFECLFLLIFVGLQVLLAIYYQKNKLFAESVILSIFCLTFANPLFFSLLYFFFEGTFSGTETLVTISNVLDVFGFPFNIFYTMVPQIIMLIVPIIPVVFLIVMVIKKDKRRYNADN